MHHKITAITVLQLFSFMLVISLIPRLKSRVHGFNGLNRFVLLDMYFQITSQKELSNVD